MSNVPVISVSVLRPYIKFLNDVGVPLDRYFRRSKIPLFFADDPAKFIPTESFWSFAGEVEKREALNNLGLHVALAEGADCLNPNHRQLLAAAPTLLVGLKKSIAALDRESSGSYLRLDLKSEEVVRFTHHPTFGNEHPYHGMMAMFALFGMLEIVRVYLGHDWQPDAIGAPDRNAKDILAEFLPDSRFRRHHSCTYIEFRRDLLDTPPMVTVREQTAPSLITAQAHAPESFRDTVALLLDGYLPGQPPTIPAFAELLRISVRSLQRQLAASGTSFRNEVLTSRYRMAKRLLLESDEPVDMIANKLGYRHSTHFIHFFSNIAGITPLQYRKRHLKK